MKSKSDDIELARRELILLYIGIKIRKEEEVINNNSIILLIQALALTEEEYNKEIEDLKDKSLLDMVNYIKDSIDVIVNFKIDDIIDEYKSDKNENAATDLETLLQKEEAAIREHISYEHKIKIEYETLLDKMEIMELEHKLLVYQVVRLNYKFNFIL